MPSVIAASVSAVLRLAVALALVLLALAPAAQAGGPAMTLGAAEDVVRSTDLVRAKADMTLLRLAGFRAVRVTSTWPGRIAGPTATERTTLRNVVSAATLSGVRVYLSIYHTGSRVTPLSPESRAQFAAYAGAVARAVPTVRDVIVGNEPNLNRFWLPQFNVDGSDAAAPAYLQMLAETYDALKAVSPSIRVYGGALAPRGIDRPGTGRDTHSPTAFIRDMGAAYRTSGRTTAVMDAFAFHPYADNSSQSPDFAHPLTTTIGLADYGKLVALLGEAFDGTAQPGSRLPILYDEFGVETLVPRAKAPSYSGTEPATTRPVDEATQAAYYRRALELAFCQPTISGILLFHSHDEPALGSWQSGVYYADGTPKTSLEAVRDALADTRGGSVSRCPALALTPKALTLRFPSASGLKARPLGFRLRCSLDCVYRARLQKLPRSSTTSATSGRAAAGQTLRVTFPARRIAAGRYRIALTLVHPVNPGAPLARTSPPFTLAP
jgi:hypothetical protein